MANIVAIGSFSINYEKSLLFIVPLAVFFLHVVIVLHHIHKKVPPVDEIWSQFPMNTPVLLHTDAVFFLFCFMREPHSHPGFSDVC